MNRKLSSGLAAAVLAGALASSGCGRLNVDPVLLGVRGVTSVITYIARDGFEDTMKILPIIMVTPDYY